MDTDRGSSSQRHVSYSDQLANQHRVDDILTQYVDQAGGLIEAGVAGDLMPIITEKFDLAPNDVWNSLGRSLLSNKIGYTVGSLPDNKQIGKSLKAIRTLGVQ